MNNIQAYQEHQMNLNNQLACFNFKLTLQKDENQVWERDYTCIRDSHGGGGDFWWRF